MDTEQSQQSQEKMQTDSAFGQLISGGFTPGMSPASDPSTDLGQWQREYFELAEQTIRTVRKVAEQQQLHAMKRQIVQEVTTQVLSAIKSDPSLSGKR